MPTNEERHEVAARMREIGSKIAPSEWPNWGDAICESWHAMRESIGADQGNPYDDHKEMCNILADLIEPEQVNGETSDGYHTFNELYHHRALLFSVIVRNYPELCWKSKRHHDGDMYEGMFIVGINTPDGQASYHYDIEPYWDMFDCEELEFAPEWDGHTPDQAIERIGKLTRHAPERTCTMSTNFRYFRTEVVVWFCSECGSPIYNDMKPSYCLYCGAKVVDE